MEIITKERVVREIVVKVYLSDLIFFLKQRNALKSFEQHVNWERIKDVSPKLWISCGFLWNETLEGNLFWDKVNKEWKDFLKADFEEQICYESPFIKK